MSLRLSSIHRYLVKSAQGEALEQATTEPWGLAGDRRWMVVDADGDMRTSRKDPRLLLIWPRATEAGLLLEAPGRTPIEVPTPAAESQEIRIFGWPTTGTDAGEPAAAWLSEVLGRPARLIYQSDPTVRPLDPRFARPEDRVSFADGYPLLVTTRSSLAALNDAIIEGGAEPVPMHRFRPNLVVEGGEAWSEDGWRRIRVGEAMFRAVKGCARCVMTTKEPRHADDDVDGGPEPLRTLARIRRFGSGVWFGVNLIPDGTPGTRIRPGDPVEIVECGSADAPLGSL